MGIEAVLFDNDGTLFDNQQRSIDEFSKVLHRLNLKEDPSKVWYDIHMGHPASRIAKLALKRAHRVIFNIRQIRKMMRTASVLSMANAVPFISKEDYNKIGDRYKVAIVTQNQEDAITLEYEEKKMNHPDEIYAGGMKRKFKKLKGALKDFNIKPYETIFFTDTIGDLKQAERADIPTIGVSWGLHGDLLLKEDIRKKYGISKYLMTLDKPKEILETIERYSTPKVWEREVKSLYNLSR